MARKDNHDVITAFHRLTEAAEEYVNRSPRVKRLQTQRSTLLDAIANAQLVLSVHRLPQEPVSERPGRSPTDKGRVLLEKEVKNVRAALQQLQRRLEPVSSELETLHTRAQRAKDLLVKALGKQEQDDGVEQG
jgi:hypothetical protein